MVAAPYCLNFHLFTLFSCIKKIVQSCGHVALSYLALQNNSFDCLVLIPHRQLGNLYIKKQKTVMKVFSSGDSLYTKRVYTVRYVRKSECLRRKSGILPGSVTCVASFVCRTSLCKQGGSFMYRYMCPQW